MTCIFFIFDIALNVFANRVWSEKNTMRVLQHRKFQLCQGVPDMLGKTGTHQHDPVKIPDGWGKFFQIDIDQ